MKPIITVSIHGNGAYVAWTLRKAGGIQKRTSQTSFWMVDGKRVSAGEAFRCVSPRQY